MLDEVYRIGREAYINAAAHAQASRIEIMIEYGLRDFRLAVQDDGRGIDPQILKKGRQGHFGLAGMRERAQAIGSVLKIRTRAGAGTEVELIVPAALAYPRSGFHRTRWPWRLRERYPKAKEETR